MLASLGTLFIALSCFATSNANRLKLSEVETRFAQSAAFTSTEKALESLQLDYQSRDLVLEPTLSFTAQSIRDRRETFSSSAKSQTQDFDLTLEKPFSTGTTFTLNPSIDQSRYPSQSPQNRGTAEWRLGLSQNLWQDAFGRSTRLRRERERNEWLQQRALIQLKRARLLVDMESLYWDFALAIREAELRERNVKRGQEILQWMKSRLARSAAENTDYLQAQALLATRKLQLEVVQQSLTQLKLKLHRYFSPMDWQPDPDELARRRPVESLVVSWPENSGTSPQPLEFHASNGETEAARIKARETRESIRPKLSLELAYGKNAIDTTAGTAARHSVEEEHEYGAIGLTLKTGLGLADEWRKVEAANAAVRSAELARESLQQESQVAWPRLMQNLEAYHKRVDQAHELVKIQEAKAVADRKRFRMGRATAFESITFEQDAAEAEIALWSLYAQLRKAEAEARLFAR
ncbi:MAG: TolC family protein [Bdellovibrionales bacterium]